MTDKRKPEPIKDERFVMIVTDDKKTVAMSIDDALEHIVESARERGETVIEKEDVKE